jgi:hypothetical protein
MLSRLPSILIALALAACAHHHASPDDDARELAQDGSDSSAVENDTETMTTSFVAPTGAQLSLASAGGLLGSTMNLADVGDVVVGSYVPAGCATVVNDTASRTVTYTFDRCSGPYGLLNVSGTVKVAYANPEPARLILDFTGTNLQVNKAAVDWSAHAEITAFPAAARREMTWSAHLSGTTARGRALVRRVTRSIVWIVGGECVTVNGSSDGQVGSRGIRTDLIHYSRCKGQCPAQGSEIRITNLENGRSIDIQYDGGRLARYTAPSGVQTEITLACGL